MGSVTYSVIIPTHNEGDELRATVQNALDTAACCSRHADGLEVIVVDDQCSDGSVDAMFDALHDAAPVEVLSGEQRLGCTGAKRVGADQARGEMLVFTDSHCRYGERWLHHLEDGMADLGGPEAGLFGPAMGVLQNPSQVEYGMYWANADMWRSFLPDIAPDANGVRANRPALFVSGNGQAIAKALYDDIGGFDDGMLPPWGGEDEEICLRLWRYGYRVNIVPQWQMLHMWRESGFPYEVPYHVPLHNTLRVALLHLDEGRYRRVLDALFAKLSDITVGGQWEGVPDTQRFAQFLDAVWHIQGASEALHSRAMHHASREERTIDEIFEMFGMEW